jgi:hypothetical protein
MLKELLGAGHEIQDVNRRFLTKRSTNPFLLGVAFQKLPIELRRHWWQETDYGQRAPSPALVAMIAAYVGSVAWQCSEMLKAQENPIVREDADERNGVSL